MASSRKSPLADKVAARLAPQLPPGSSLLVGLSGGMDSVVLLHLLHELAPNQDWKLSALHVHHGISPNADAWADFCTGLCQSLSIPLHVEQVNIAPLRGEHGIEAAAPRLRYEAYARQGCDFVALAHHADDQAETLMLQLLRGSGVKGAAAMPLLGMRDGLNVVRPLLDIARAELLAYAEACGLRWIEDESNADVSYPRNFLRHRAFPVIEERFPACREMLARSAGHLAEASDLLDDLAAIDGKEAMDGESLDVAALRALPVPRAKNLLRHFLHLRGALMPQAAQIDDMLRQLCGARDDAAVRVKFGEYWIFRYRDRAYVSTALGECDRDLVVEWKDESELYWAALEATLRFVRVQGRGISIERLGRAPLTLRLRNGGESLRPRKGATPRTLKNLMQELGVPPWQRERLPLLYCGDELVAVAGVAVAAAFQTQPGEEGIEIVFA